MISKPQPTVMPHRTEPRSALDISIIIVNHNVKHLLLQCLRSVEQALQGLSGEIIVVDNASKDGSVEYFKENFKIEGGPIETN